MDNLEEAITYFHKSLALNRDCIVTSTILKTCIEDFMDEESVIDDIYGKSSWNSSSSTYATTKNTNLFPPIEEEESTAMKYTGMKLKFDDEDISANSDDIDPNVIMTMSMDM